MWLRVQDMPSAVTRESECPAITNYSCEKFMPADKRCMPPTDIESSPPRPPILKAVNCIQTIPRADAHADRSAACSLLRAPNQKLNLKISDSRRSAVHCVGAADWTIVAGFARSCRPWRGSQPRSIRTLENLPDNAMGPSGVAHSVVDDLCEVLAAGVVEARHGDPAILRAQNKITIRQLKSVPSQNLYVFRFARTTTSKQRCKRQP